MRNVSRMRLPEFILANIEPILNEWEIFARSVNADGTMDELALRDHAEDILRATARDMMSHQTGTEQLEKSKGQGQDNAGSRQLDTASAVHAVGRVHSGFDLMEVLSEYRALRASVIRLWRESRPDPDRNDLDDLTRFNESIDQSIAIAVGSFTHQVDRSRQMFLAILGHDLRNPLNSMMVSAELLSVTGNLDHESSKTVAQITSSAQAMARLISDLLDFTGSGLGAAMPVTTAPMDLKTLGEEVIAEMRSANPARTIRFQPHGDLTGEWDGARMRQVISNLLGNAIQHGGGTGPVELTINAEGDGILLTVHNEGPPIPHDALATIFDPLVRGTSAELQKQRRPGSIGLGLYIAREVVAAHGGTIDVTSSVQHGTTFIVRLPRRTNSPTVADASASVSP